MEIHLRYLRCLLVSYYCTHFTKRYFMILNVRRIENFIVLFIGFHSLFLGLAMAFQTMHILQLFGWDYKGPMFFPTQSGIFLALFGVLFLTFLWYRNLIWFIVVIKGTAVLFFVSQKFILGSDAPRAVLIAAVFDGSMGALVAMVLIWQKYANKKNLSILHNSSSLSTRSYVR